MKLTLLVLLCGLKSMSKFLRLCKNFQSYKDCLGSGLTCQVCDGPNGQCNTPSENYNVTSVVCPEENDACLYKAISMCIPRVPTSFGWDFIKKLKISRRRKKIKIRQFVYILAKQCGSNFNLTNFLTKNSALIFSLFPKKNFSCKTYWPLYCDDFETL